MLLPILPVPLIPSSIWPLKSPIPILFIVFILTFVFPSVNPSEDSLAMHFVLLPLAFVSTPVTPDVLAGAFQVVVHEVALEGGALGSCEFAVALFLALDVCSYVFGSVRPCLQSLTLLRVPNPLPLVACPVLMRIGPVSMGLIIYPLAFIHIAFLVDQPPIPLSLVVLPESLINTPIIPYLLSLPLSLPIEPLPMINRLLHLKRPASWIFLQLFLVSLTQRIFRVVKFPELVLRLFC